MAFALSTYMCDNLKINPPRLVIIISPKGGPNTETLAPILLHLLKLVVCFRFPICVEVTAELCGLLR